MSFEEVFGGIRNEFAHIIRVGVEEVFVPLGMGWVIRKGLGHYAWVLRRFLCRYDWVLNILLCP